MDEHTQLQGEPQATASVQKTAQANTLAIPIAIVFGFALIAAAIFFTGGVSGLNGTPAVQQIEEEPALAKTGPVRPIDESDHIRGNPNAPIMIIEYSDFDCPFCKNFHETMNQVMAEYGNEGKVAWAYRHFPLEQLHPSAPHIAAASECVAELGGNEAFWKFADLVFGERVGNEPTNISRLPEFAVSSGVSETAFNSCVEEGRTKTLVEEDFNDGVNAGAQGTPYSLVLVGGQQGVINGAQPYEYVSSVLDTLIGQIQKEETAQ